MKKTKTQAKISKVMREYKAGNILDFPFLHKKSFTM